MQRFLSLRIAAVALCLCSAACGDDDSAAIKSGGKDGGTKGGTKSIEVAGDWQNQFGMEEVIDDKMWAGFIMIEFDNAKNLAITQNAKDDKYNPGKFNATVWTEPTADGFAYCQYVFGKDTADEAKSAKNTADEKDLKKGCGGFEWTKDKPYTGADE